MEFWTLIGTAAAFCGAVSLIPEVIKAYKTHHLKDVSWGMLFFLMLSSGLWGSYGLHINDIPLALSASMNLVLEIILIYMKWHYSATGKPLSQHIGNKKNTLEPAMENEIAEETDERQT